MRPLGDAACGPSACGHRREANRTAARRRAAVAPAAAGDCGHTQRSRCSPLGNVARALVARRGEPLLNVTFFGVRGSTPCPCDENRRYGGNTSCVALDAPGHDPIVLDLGTGLALLGQHPAHRRVVPGLGPGHPHALGPRAGAAVLRARSSRPGARLDIYGPPQEAGSLAEAFHQFVRPPFFPVTVEELYGQISFHDVADCDVEIDGAKVRVRPVPHVGRHQRLPGRGGRRLGRLPRPTTRCPTTAATA